MIGLLLVTHGRLGEEMVTCAEGVVGHQQHVQSLGLAPSESPETFAQRVRESLQSLTSPAGVLVFSDMLGGTPCNVGVRQVRDARLPYEVVTGVNLPMLLSAFNHRHHMPLAQLAQKLVEDSPRNITRPLAFLKQTLGGAE